MGIINRNVKSKANIVCGIALSGKQLFVLRHLAKSVVFLDFADTHSVRIVTQFLEYVQKYVVLVVKKGHWMLVGGLGKRL